MNLPVNLISLVLMRLLVISVKLPKYGRVCDGDSYVCIRRPHTYNCLSFVAGGLYPIKICAVVMINSMRAARVRF